MIDRASRKNGRRGPAIKKNPNKPLRAAVMKRVSCGSRECPAIERVSCGSRECPADRESVLLWRECPAIERVRPALERVSCD